MWLLIDDKRDLNCDVIARTPEAARRLLAIGGWECVCLDHDLGAEEDGYQIAKWAIENNLLPGKVQLVTSNPVGRMNLRAVLESGGWTTKDGTNFAN